MAAKSEVAPGAAKEFVISRVFDAPRKLVWKAYTDRDDMMQWFGPKGFKMISATMDLRPGGVFHYGLEAPNGQKMWGKFIYREIVAPERIEHIVSFSDEKQGVTRHPMAPSWPLQTLAKATFTDESGKTRITLRWSPYEATEEERKTFDAGHDSMRQGWGGTMDQLDEHLAKAKKKS